MEYTIASPRNESDEEKKQNTSMKEFTSLAGSFSSDAAGPNPVNDFARVL